jgi:hypothetical protein
MNGGSKWAAAVPTGPWRTRPRGRSLRVRCFGGRRLPSLFHTCRVRRHPHDPPGVVRSAGSSPPAAHEPCVATRVLPVGLEALLHRRVRDVGSPFPRCHITILPWVLIPLEATPALVGSRGLPRVRSRRSGRGRSHSGPESVRGGSRSHRWLQTSWGFRRQRTASTWGRGSIPKKGATHTGVWLAVSVGLGPLTSSCEKVPFHLSATDFPRCVSGSHQQTFDLAVLRTNLGPGANLTLLRAHCVQVAQTPVS